MRDSLPAKWSTAELGDLVTVCRPRADPREFPDMPFVGMDNVEAHTMRLLGTVPAGTMRSNATHFYPQDVLYGRLRPYLNKVLAPTFEGLASAEFIPLTPEPGIDRDFVRYRVNAADFVSFTSHLDEGDRPRVDWNGIRQFQVFLPPSAEQGRIVEIVDSYVTRLDAAVASLERVQAKLKAYRASVLKAAVEGRLVPTEASLARAENRAYEPAEALLARILKERRRRWEQAGLGKLKAAGKTPKDDKWKAKYEGPTAPDTSTLPELPEGWCWANVGQLITSLDQGWSPRCDKRPASFDEWGVMKTTAVQHLAFLQDENKAITDDLEPRPGLEIRAGDLLVTRAGPRVRVGVCCLVRRTRPRVMLCDKVYRLRVAPGVSASYIELALNSPDALDEIEKLKTGISDSGVNLTQERFQELVIPLPPRREQDAIELAVAQQSSIRDEVARTSQAALQRVARLKQAILKWAFEGKLVDQDPADEPAEKLVARIRAERAAAAPTKKSGGRRAKAAA